MICGNMLYSRVSRNISRDKVEANENRLKTGEVKNFQLLESLLLLQNSRLFLKIFNFLKVPKEKVQGHLKKVLCK
jgi:hypothetical protein